FDERAPLWIALNGKSFSNLAERYHADEELVVDLRFKPRCYRRIRTRAAQFRRDVGVQKETAHRSTGRPVDGLRENSKSIPRSGANTSTRLFLPAGRLPGSPGFSGAIE